MLNRTSQMNGKGRVRTNQGNLGENVCVNKKGISKTHVDFLPNKNGGGRSGQCILQKGWKDTSAYVTCIQTVAS